MLYEVISFLTPLFAHIRMSAVALLFDVIQASQTPTTQCNRLVPFLRHVVQCGTPTPGFTHHISRFLDLLSHSEKALGLQATGPPDCCQPLSVARLDASPAKQRFKNPSFLTWRVLRTDSRPVLNVQIRAIEIQELPVFRFLLLKELERLMTSILPGLHQHQHRHLTTGTLLLDYSDLTPQECISESMKFQCNEIRKIVEAVGASLLSAVIVKVNQADWGPFLWRPTFFQLMPDVELKIADGNIQSLFKFGFHEGDRHTGGAACDYQWMARPRPPRRVISRSANCCLGDVPCCTEASQARDQLRNRMFAPTVQTRSTPLSRVSSGDVKLCVFFEADVM